jgi:hypothetical protein
MRFADLAGFRAAVDQLQRAFDAQLERERAER